MPKRRKKEGWSLSPFLQTFFFVLQKGGERRTMRRERKESGPKHLSFLPDIFFGAL